MNEENAIAVVGSVSNDEGCQLIGLTCCDSMVLAQANYTAMLAIEQLEKDKPIIKKLRDLVAMFPPEADS